MKMTFLERVHKLERLHRLIRRKGTGTPEELASRLNVCVRTAYKFIEDLRGLGAPIAYCPQRQSYYYTENITFNFTASILPASESRRFKGGKSMDFRFAPPLAQLRL